MFQMFIIIFRHIQFLNSIIDEDKIFKISYLIKKSNINVIIELEKHYVQTN